MRHVAEVGRRWRTVTGLVLLACTACRPIPGSALGMRTPTDSGATRIPAVLPGITVLLDDSVGLVRGKTVGLVTNQTGVDERGVSDVDLLMADSRARAAGVRLVTLFSPEHGIRGTADRMDLPSGRDERSGLPVISLYGRTTLPPPDSALRRLDVLLFDLPDIGTRTWTYVGNLVYALRACKRAGVALVVLDRPAPLTGTRRQGPLLDAALANADTSVPGRPALPYALYPFPLRHGLTMGELARFFNAELGIGAELHVVPLRGWRRSLWADQTGLAWVRPSPAMPDLTSALVYAALVAFEGSNVSVGRGTDRPFREFGAPWLDAARVAGMLERRAMPGVRFVAAEATPDRPTDGKYGGTRIPVVRVEVVDRDLVDVGRLGAAILWALGRAHPDSLRIAERTFDLRWGDPTSRRALLLGEDPEGVAGRWRRPVEEWTARASRYVLYP